MKRFSLILTCILFLFVGKVSQAQVGKFDLLSPSNATSLTVYSGNTTKIDISWQASTNATEYYWVADKSGGSFSPALIRIASNTKASDTVLTVTSGDLDDLLSSFGFSVGQTVDLDWKVVAINGKDSIYSNSTYAIKLTRGTTLGNFDLLSPTTGAKVTSFRGSNQPINITWNSSKNANSYTWHVDLPSGNFSKPLTSIKSNNSGRDTVLTLTSADVDTLLAQLGLNQGDSVDVIWTVTSTDTLTKDIMFANKEFDISLKRSKISAFAINSFNLLSPATGANVTVFENSNNQIQINWSKSNATGLKYTWKAYISGFVSKGAILNFDSDNGGNDTTLTLTQGAIDNILAGAGISKGGSLALDWDVYATDPLTGNSKVSSNLFTVTLTRGNGKAPNFTDFSLVSPADKAALTVYSGGIVNVNINWNSSVGANRYEWLATTTSGNFTSPLLTFRANNAGKDTGLTLLSGDIDNILASAGLLEGNSITLRWTVRATDTITNTSKFSKDVFEITLTRGFNFGSFDLGAPADSAKVVVFESSINLVNITWNKSRNANKYTWIAILPNGNFSSPALSFVSNNNGKDTVLSLTEDAIDKVLASLGLQAGQNATIFWTVKAEDTLSSQSRLANQNRAVTLERGIRVGINESNFTNEQIKLFPNPAIDKITISGLNGNSIYQIIDLKGAIQSEGNLLNSNSQIDIANLNRGSYLIKIISGGKTSTKIFQVQ